MSFNLGFFDHSNNFIDRLGRMALVIGACFGSSVMADQPNPLNNVYFGEQHLHSSMSADAFATGNRLSPEKSYRFARGFPVKQSGTGTTIQKSTPYDWVALTDHAEYLGVMPDLGNSENPLSKHPLAQLINSTDPKKQAEAVNTILATYKSGIPIIDFVGAKEIRSNWQRQIEMANTYNEPGIFTTIIAFEWTSIPNSRNLHRNVFFRGDNGPPAPFSAFDSNDPEDLWTYLEVQRTAGFESIAISHNGNVSDGLMYSTKRYNGLPLDRRYVERRALNEPLTEIIQAKGQSDAHPVLSPNDEFANFEMFPNLINTQIESKIEGGYIRQALAKGLELERTLGTNPFKFGIVSGSDSHSGYSGNEEFNYTGTHGVIDDTVERRMSGEVSVAGDTATKFGTPGATGVWAPENTREAIFDALKRKETYGTSGPLIRLRFFGGWDFPQDLTERRDFIATAYDTGVPMGGDLPNSLASGNSPKFAVSALKDPESGHLDRIQIIKAWVIDGLPQERIYDVALSDNRTVDPDSGKAPSVGNTVDIKTATYSNDIGDSELSAVWTDPEFDPTQRAVYYVRVLEIPTPRWSTYDAKTLGIEPPDDVPPTIQERAWSSPIWYTP